MTPDVTTLISNCSPASFTHICIIIHLLRGKLDPETLQILHVLVKYYEKCFDLNKKHMQTFKKANLNFIQSDQQFVKQLETGVTS